MNIEQEEKVLDQELSDIIGKHIAKIGIEATSRKLSSILLSVCMMQKESVIKYESQIGNVTINKIPGEKIN